MKPGRDLDMLIAEKVMGWKWVQVNNASLWVRPDFNTCPDYFTNANIDTDPSKTIFIPEYSTKIAAANELIQKLKEKFRIMIEIELSSDAPYEVRLYDHNKNNEGYGAAETLPHAVCLAALETIEQNDSE